MTTNDAHATDATPFDMPQTVPWWPCRAEHSQLPTYAVHGHPGLYFADGRKFIDRRKQRRS